jgi:hypothetical protein
VSRHVALVGTFERPPAFNISATPNMVASLNSRTISSTCRFIAAPSDQIVLFDRKRQIVGTDALPAILQELEDGRRAARKAELAQIERLIPLPAGPREPRHPQN